MVMVRFNGLLLDDHLLEAYQLFLSNNQPILLQVILTCGTDSSHYIYTCYSHLLNLNSVSTIEVDLAITMAIIVSYADSEGCMANSNNAKLKQNFPLRHTLVSRLSSCAAIELHGK